MTAVLRRIMVPAMALAVLAALVALLPAPATAADARGERVVAIARQVMDQRDLNAVILSVSVRGRPVVTTALGSSQTGIPATTRMHFRVGAVSIPYVATVLLQLQDEGVLSLDDPVGRWLADLPNADRVTLRMLANFSSGYPDYVPRTRFVRAFYDDPFRRWTQQELLDFAFATPPLYEPGTDWNYAHTNYVILGRALARITGKPLGRLIRERVLRPLRLRNTRDDSTTAAIPRPVLHAFTAERGRYEESTFWNPSWTLARGAIMTSDIRDMRRSAVAIGRGTLVSARAHEEQLAPTTAGLGPLTPSLYYGLGVVVQGKWIAQNPLFGGYGGVMAYLPSRDIAIAVVTTKGPKSKVEGNDSEEIYHRLARYLAPGQAPPRLP